MFIQYFIGLAKSKGFRQNIKRGEWSYRGVVYRREGFKPTAYYEIGL